MVCLAVLDSVLHTLQMVWHALAEWVSAWGWIFGVLYSVTIVVTALIVILDKRDPTRTLLWVLVLVLLPVAGFVLYIFFGQTCAGCTYSGAKCPSTFPAFAPP